MSLRHRFRARVRYDGEGFHGVQKNVRTQDGTELRTILSTLEHELRPALGQEVKFTVAGRTDAGVSATGQVVSFDADAVLNDAHQPLLRVHGVPRRDSDLANALNACLPDDLQLLEIGTVPRSFDVVRDCRFKRYRYRLPPCQPNDDDAQALRILKMVASHCARASRNRAAAEEKEADDGQAALGLEHRGSRKRRRRRKREPLEILDVEAMARAAALFEGTHDFGAFQASRGDQKGTVRTVFRCAVERRKAGCENMSRHGSAAGGRGGGDGDDDSIVAQAGEAYDLVIEGDGFLYKMVRIIAGTLLMVGMRLAPVETVLVALKKERQAGQADDLAASVLGSPQNELRRRGIVGPTLPPEPLCLEHVEYDRDHESASVE